MIGAPIGSRLADFIPEPLLLTIFAASWSRLQFECGSRPMKDPPICPLSTMIMPAQLVEEIPKADCVYFTMCPATWCCGTKHWRPHWNVWRWRRLYYCPRPGLIRLHGNATSHRNFPANHHAGQSVWHNQSHRRRERSFSTDGWTVYGWQSSWLVHRQLACTALGRTNASASVRDLHSTGRIVCHSSKPYTVALQPRWSSSYVSEQKNYCAHHAQLLLNAGLPIAIG